MGRLTAKMELFCQEYIVDLNATQAAIRAGYSEKTAQRIGSENLSKPLIQQRIQEMMHARSEAVEIDAQWVVERLIKVHDRCMQEEQVLDREGAPTGEYTFAHAGANKALELLGRHLAMFNDKLKLQGELKHKPLSPDDLSNSDPIEAAKVYERLVSEE